jgi:phosphinothricin acetyltransferase
MDRTIRKIEITDLDAVNEIYNQAVRSKYQTAETEETSLEYRRSWYEENLSGIYPIYVVEEGGEVAGWISLSEYRKGRKALRFTSEVSFYIRKDRQGQGIGTQLLAWDMPNVAEFDGIECNHQYYGLRLAE